MKPTRPIVRYHGGKWLLAPWIISHFPEHKVYVEPFGGGGNVLLRKPRAFAEVYNDLDGEIVALFRVLRDRGAELIRALELTPFARAEFLGAYEPTTDELERSRRAIVRSYMGFGSDGIHSKNVTGFRGKSMRSGTTPADDWRNLPGAIPALIDRMRGVVIEQMDAGAVMARYDQADALHYVDPPYVHSTRTRVHMGRGYRHELRDEDHRSLAEQLHALRGAVVLSGYDCPLYQELFPAPTWTRVEKQTLTNGNAGAGGNATKRIECLWLKGIDLLSPEFQFTD